MCLGTCQPRPVLSLSCGLLQSVPQQEVKMLMLESLGTEEDEAWKTDPKPPPVVSTSYEIAPLSLMKLSSPVDEVKLGLRLTGPFSSAKKDVVYINIADKSDLWGLFIGYCLSFFRRHSVVFVTCFSCAILWSGTNGSLLSTVWR